MCRWGDTVSVTVDGRTFYVDSCISELVFTLNKAGLKTVASCCGHLKRPANIALADGREIVICPDFATARKIDDYLDTIGFGPINPLSQGLGDHDDPLVGPEGG